MPTPVDYADRIFPSCARSNSGGSKRVGYAAQVEATHSEYLVDSGAGVEGRLSRLLCCGSEESGTWITQTTQREGGSDAPAVARLGTSTQRPAPDRRYARRVGAFRIEMFEATSHGR